MRTIDSFLADKFRFKAPFVVKYRDRKTMSETDELRTDSGSHLEEEDAYKVIVNSKRAHPDRYVDFIFDANGEEVSRHE